VQPIADDVLHFGVRFWTPDTTTWDRSPDGAETPALVAWDSTRGLLPSGDPDFPYGRGPDSLLVGSDDMWPRLMRLTLVLDEQGSERGAATLAEGISETTRRLALSSTTALRDEQRPDHVLVDGEWMIVRSLEGRVLEVERGARGTLAVTHEAGATVRTGKAFERVLELSVAREVFGR
jgi:hypothetical protein